MNIGRLAIRAAITAAITLATIMGLLALWLNFAEWKQRQAGEKLAQAKAAADAAAAAEDTLPSPCDLPTGDLTLRGARQP